MTLFAGAFNRRQDQPIPDSVCENLLRVISRNTTDEAHTFRDDRCFIAKVDIGAISGNAFRIADDGSISVLAGEPIVDVGDREQFQSRSKDLELLHDSWTREDWRMLASARGVFSAVHYQPKTGKLLLISDKLCIRPLYYWTDERFVIFATSLRILEGVDAIPKTMDLRGVTELCGLGYPLGNRTPYSAISLLNAAEIVRVEEGRITQQRYWSWDELEPSKHTGRELLSELYDSFKRAVELRIGNDKTTVAYLSGGLDSRCAVAALLERDVNVHTFNFALPGTQDYLFGNQFAAQAGTIHKAVPKVHGDLTPDYSTLMARAWGASANRNESPAERPSLVWSGEGGSVALGHVHLNEEIVRLMRGGQTAEAIETYLVHEHASVPARLFQSGTGDYLNRALHEGIREELDRLHCADPARSFFLYLLLNDQRRKLSSHFENIDLHRLELQLPFFDSEFLAQIISLPIDSCLRHGFYLKWLHLFSPVVTKIPWQSYPGHEPCPVPNTANAAYQWDDKHQQEQKKALKADLVAHAKQMLGATDFPDEILKKKYLRIASLIYGLGLRDYSYVIEAGWKYYTFWKLCGGRYEPFSQIARSPGSESNATATQYHAEAKLNSGTVK